MPGKPYEDHRSSRPGQEGTYPSLVACNAVDELGSGSPNVCVASRQLETNDGEILQHFQEQRDMVYTSDHPYNLSWCLPSLGIVKSVVDLISSTPRVNSDR